MARTFLRTAANYQIGTFSDQCCAMHILTPRADSGHSLHMHDLHDASVKAAIDIEAGSKNAAINLMAAECPICEFDFLAACARSVENAASA